MSLELFQVLLFFQLLTPYKNTADHIKNLGCKTEFIVKKKNHNGGHLFLIFKEVLGWTSDK